MAAKQSRYCIDSCSLTELRRTYPLPHFKSVWDLVDSLAQEGRLISVDECFQELAAQDDEIKEWADAHSDIFLSLDEDIQTAARAILKHYPRLIDVKKKKSSADPFLIAAAQIHSAIVVTQEKKSGGPPALKIPDVCGKLDIPCITLLDLIKREGLK